MNPKADSTRPSVHHWNLGAAAAQPAFAAPRLQPPGTQVLDGSRLQLRLSVSIGDSGSAQVPAAAFELLRRMPRVDSLREAASGLGCSYRHAWALIRGAERALGAALIDTRRGRGTQLTPYGALLAAALEKIESKLASELDAATQALSAALAIGRSRATPDAAGTAATSRPVRAHTRRAA